MLRSAAMLIPAQVGGGGGGGGGNNSTGEPTTAKNIWSKIMGPVMPELSGAWWIVLHFVLPLALIVGVIGMVYAALFGSKTMMGRSRGMILGVPLTLFLISAAALVSNWIIAEYR